MLVKTILCAAALGASVAQADFMVYTEPPIPTSAIPSFANPSSAAAWTSSVGFNARLAWIYHTSTLGDAYQSSSSSAASEIAAFASTASNYSIPADVTNPAATQTFLTKPDWYTALPTGARSFKESQVADQFSIVRSVIDRGVSATATTGSPGAAGARATPAAGLGVGFGGMAIAAAGMFL